MAITSDELARVGKVALDGYLKNNPIDQVEMARPLFKALSQKKKPFFGKEYIVEQLRTGYDSSGKWYDSTTTLEFKNRDGNAQAKFPWYSFHDGLTINEQELKAAGIALNDSSKPSKISQYEQSVLLDLFENKMEAFRLGAQERFSRDLHLNGASDAKQIVGLDGLLPLDNTTGTVGGFNRATMPWWRHYADKTLTAATMHDKMTAAWRACNKRGQGQPGLILAGGAFIDEYRKAAQQNGILGSAVRNVSDSGRGGVEFDIAVSGLYFNGVPIQYCPEWDDNFGGADSTPNDWSKRCYFINQNHLTLRTLQSQNQSDMKDAKKQGDFVIRTAPRDRTSFNHYWSVTWDGSLTMNLPSAHAALCLG